MRYCCYLIALTLSLGIASRLRADSWEFPKTATYESKNKEYRFTVTPADPIASARLAQARALAQAEKAKLDPPAAKKLAEQKPPAHLAGAPPAARAVYDWNTRPRTGSMNWSGSNSCETTCLR
jgi:hypothetical protein